MMAFHLQRKSEGDDREVKPPDMKGDKRETQWLAACNERVDR
jgi:hypothetical protein